MCTGRQLLWSTGSTAGCSYPTDYKKIPDRKKNFRHTPFPARNHNSRILFRYTNNRLKRPRMRIEMYWCCRHPLRLLRQQQRDSNPANNQRCNYRPLSNTLFRRRRRHGYTYHSRQQRIPRSRAQSSFHPDFYSKSCTRPHLLSYRSIAK